MKTTLQHAQGVTLSPQGEAHQTLMAAHLADNSSQDVPA